MEQTPFYRTRMGSAFYERTMPELVKQLARLNAHLEEILAGELGQATTDLIVAVDRVLETEITPGSPATRSAFAELRERAQIARAAVGTRKEK